MIEEHDWIIKNINRVIPHPESATFRTQPRARAQVYD